LKSLASINEITSEGFKAYQESFENQAHSAISEIQESQERFRILFEHAPDAYYLNDLNGNFIDGNKAAEELIGFKKEELIGKNFFSLGILPPNQFQIVMELLSKNIQKMATGPDEVVLIRKDGKPINLEIRTHPVKIGDRAVVLGIARDITERKQVEMALRKSEERFRIAAQSTSDLIYERDYQTGLGEFYGDIDGKQGYTRGEFPRSLIGWWENIHPEDLPRVMEAMKKLIQSGEQFCESYRLRKKDGTYIEWFDRASLVMSELGDPEKWVGAAANITELKRAEEEKAKLEAQLYQSQKLEAIGKLAGGVAHDFNNLLTGIQGYTELIMQAVPQNDPMQDDLSEILKAASQAASLTKQLLGFSRNQVIAPKIVDLNGLISFSRKMLSRVIGEDIQLEFIPGMDLGSIKVDPNQIDQILINLTVNARDAMPNGGKLIIKTSNFTLDENCFELYSEAEAGKYAILTVMDSGCGMDDKTKSRIFEPFFTTKEKGKGTGLGLSTVYGIVKQNKGFINVQSDPGIGTSFNIFIPCAEGEPVSIMKPTVNALPKCEETVLVVEDEKALLNLMEKLLTKQGYHVLASNSPGDAIELCKKNQEKIHLVLTDVVMPLMNGMELYEKIKCIKHDIKVLYMSGYMGDIITNHGVLEEGASFIQKPFTMESLAKKVREILDK